MLNISGGGSIGARVAVLEVGNVFEEDLAPKEPDMNRSRRVLLHLCLCVHWLD